jgi:uncharacterized pyridoxamine 5'-phosphate oxidase family protein
LKLHHFGGENMDIKKVKEILADGTIGYFATTNGEQLEVRGWEYEFSEDDKFYFCTANTKNVYKEMKANPQVAFAGVSNDYNIRISGKAAFVSDASKKEEYFKRLSAGVQGLYKSADNPALEIFCIESGEVKINKGYEPFEVVKF